jgi:hypothetical protein
MELDGLTQEIKIDHPLGIRSENVLPRVAALRDMMRDVNCNHTSQTSHGGQNIRKRPDGPRFPRRRAGSLSF